MQTVFRLIATHGAEILEAWTEAAKNATSARSLSSLELASLMPEYLTLLGQGSTRAEARLSAAQGALIERHLANRLREGFHLNEILTEFAVLGRCVSRFVLESPNGAQISAAEIASLYSELYQTATAVTRIFNEQLLEDEQTMKRYGRLLERIAHQPLGARDPSVRTGQPLDDALALIREAMGARAAALLVFTGSGGTETSAIGPGADEIENMARSLETTTFSGEAGATGVASGEVKPTPALRAHDVHSLLRVQLAVHDALRCVLYVGIEEERPFTASEIRRLEGLSRALTIHIDTARLRADLHVTLDEVRAERAVRERAISVLVREVRGPLAAARASARRLATEPDADRASELDAALGRIERVVDGFLASTPAMALERER